MKLYESIVFNHISKESRVIDLGCGDGELLHQLIQKKQCKAYGVEKNFESVLKTMGKGIPTFQGDILEGLLQFEDNAFDVAVLSQTLQQVFNPIDIIKELCRVSKSAIITFPNFGFWRVRWQLLTSGHSPKTKQLPYEWYNTPNIRVITINDFRQLCNENKLVIQKEIPLVKFKLQRLLFPLGLTNLFTQKGIFIIKNGDTKI